MKSEPHYSQLDYQDRQTIAISLEQGLSIRAIGRVLNRSASTISREIARNTGGNGYLLKHRKIEFRTEKRGRHKDEHELAELLKDAPKDSMTDLCELMNGYGFDLITLIVQTLAREHAIRAPPQPPASQ